MDIVERLRKFESVKDYWGDWEIAKEAADEIERLREALRYILTHCESDSPPNAKALILFVNNALKEDK